MLNTTLAKNCMLLKKKIDKNKFTSIIPAAGKSARFKDKTNKMLFKIKNKILIQHVVDKVKKKSKEIIFICSKDNIEKLKKKIKNKKSVFVLQNKQNGMATAIQKSFPFIKTSNCLIIWGDQIGINQKTIDLTIHHHINNNAKITFPIVWNKKPYTLISFSKNNILKKIKQSREQKITEKKGYSDCGFFCCDTKFLIQNLNRCIQKKNNLTKKTKEYDFLTSLKYFKPKNKIEIFISKEKNDFLGINYLKDVSKLK